MKTRFFCILSGSLIIIAAIIIFGINNNLWQPGFQPENAWTLLVCAPFLIWMLAFGVNFINSFGFYSGLGLLIYEKGFISQENTYALIGFMAAFAAATALIGGSYKFIQPTILEPVTIPRVKPTVRAISTMKHIRNNFDGILGAAFNVFSGSLLYDMRKGRIETKSQFRVNVNFGNLYLILPPDVLVESTVKGNFINKLAAPKDYSSVVSISGKVRFGKLYIIGHDKES